MFLRKCFLLITFLFLVIVLAVNLYYIQITSSASKENAIFILVGISILILLLILRFDIKTSFNKFFIAIAEYYHRNSKEKNIKDKSKMFYQKMIKSMIEPIYISDDKFKIKYINSAMISLLDNKDYINKYCYNAIFNRSDICPWCKLSKIQRGETVKYDLEIPIKGKLFRISEVSLKQKNSKIYKMSILRDITDLKKTITNLQKKNKTISKIFNSLQSGIIVTHPFSHNIILINTVGAQLIGDSKKNILGKNYNEYFENFIVEEQQKLSEGKLIRKKSTITTTSGEKLPILRNTLLTKIGGNKVLLSCFIDNSTQEKIERELHFSQEKLRLVMENAKDAIIMINENGKVSYWNKAATDIFGYSENKAIGKDIHQLVAVDSSSFNIKLGMAKFKKSGKGTVLGKISELTGLRKDGSELPIELSVAPFKHYNNWNAVAIVRDISERKNNEKNIKEKDIKLKIVNKQLQENLKEIKQLANIAKKANKAKSEFLANMSHEIRTPMNGIMGMATLLADTNLDEKQIDFVHTIYSSANALLTIINEILDFSKIEAGKLQIENYDFNLQEVVEESVDLLAVAARKKHLELLSNIAPDVPVFLRGDPERIRQIIINLGNNAIKFTHQGKVSISVICKRNNSKNVKLVFSVQDTGIGIPRDKMKLIFKSFQQANNSTTHQYGGSGLGLSISKNLVELMGGKIGLESTIDVGTRFWFTLIMKKSDISFKNLGNSKKTKRIMKKNNDDIIIPPTSQKTNILLAEDNFVNRKVAVNMLQREGFKVTVARSGKETIELFKKQYFDLILMDIQMPEMDGFQATTTIRELEFKTGKHIPIIAMTAYAYKKDKEKCLDSGMDDYLSKPIHPKELFEKLGKYLSTTKINSNDIIKSTSQDSIHFDKKTLLEERLDGDEIFLKELINDFIKVSKQRLNYMKIALVENNFNTLENLGHFIKGAAANMEAIKITAIASDIERKSETQNAETIGKLIQKLTIAIDEFETITKPIVNEKQEFQEYNQVVINR